MSWRILLTVSLLVLPGAAPVLMAGEIKPMPARIAPCPDTPNCVSSDAAEPAQHVPPFTIVLPAREAWRLAGEAVKEIPRTEITEVTDSYMHAECRSMIFRFVDDLELELRPGDGMIAVRSASRTGRSDFGVNRRRVERLREILRAKGVIN